MNGGTCMHVRISSWGLHQMRKGIRGRGSAWIPLYIALQFILYSYTRELLCILEINVLLFESG